MNNNGNAEMRELAQKICSLSKDVETEVLIFKNKNALTRYAENYIHQNVSDTSYYIRVRTIMGNKTATATTNKLDDESLEYTLQSAIDATKMQKDNDKLLPLPHQQEYHATQNFIQATDEFTPQQRAEHIVKAVNICKRNGLEGAGIYSNSTSEVAIANCKGLFGYDISTNAEFSITAMKGAASGWHETITKDVHDIDVEKAAAIAVEKALKSEYPDAIKPGKYTVIMEPAAVAEFALFLLWRGFNGMDYLEGTTFLKDGLNKKIFSDKLNIYEDPYYPPIGSQPFDFEGMPVKPMTLVEKGVPRSFATNRWIANETGAENNGHAIPLPGQGAYPFSMRFDTGKSSVEKMIKNTQHGVLVTHFHYSNIIDPISLLVTGMTRDGFFLIENGKITKPLKNMRFTDSVL
ncbi:MAG: TldD/PmbA family protein, partial [Candidatus Cloacimonetes bacterium]|nr:TldD/PmbA family protein [Candidatus Cloacimonadota bacterium]